MTILEDLYNGFVFPAELVCPSTPEYRSVNHEIDDIMERLKSSLPEEDGKRLEKLEELYCRSSSLEAVSTFIYGFRLAALMMTEVYGRKGRMTIREEKE